EELQIAKVLDIPDTTLVGVAYTNGDLELLDTNTEQRNVILRTAHSLREIVLSRTGHIIAATDNDDTVYLGFLGRNIHINSQATWTTFKMQARAIAWTSDEILLVLSSDGAVWLYSSADKTWLCVPTGTADLIGVAISSDDKNAATFDLDG